ncbi:hypothetical protein ACFC1R_08510 [Kitasatospora sp. NPDC056138]|uniref:hypothetical protein n=1 Tax=Kitasatospora sp. NPDC056138 TaxID=3345724 RepID=UPI0035DFF6BD
MLSGRCLADGNNELPPPGRSRAGAAYSGAYEGNRGDDQGAEAGQGGDRRERPPAALQPVNALVQVEQSPVGLVGALQEKTESALHPPREAWEPILPGFTMRGARHTHDTWVKEDRVDRALRFSTMGWAVADIEGTYEHVTPQMRQDRLAALQARWERAGQAAQAT